MGVACSCKSDRGDEEDSDISKLRSKKYICLIAVARKVEAKLI